jgi:hypothetical protein
MDLASLVEFAVTALSTGVLFALAGGFVWLISDLAIRRPRALRAMLADSEAFARAAPDAEPQAERVPAARVALPRTVATLS